jgi:hypothetical protein
VQGPKFKPQYCQKKENENEVREENGKRRAKRDDGVSREESGKESKERGMQKPSLRGPMVF